MIVRRAASRPLVHVGQDAEAKLGVFIENLTLWHMIAEVGGDEVVVLQHFLQERTYLLPPGRARVSFQDAMAVGSELLEVWAMNRSPFQCVSWLPGNCGAP